MRDRLDRAEAVGAGAWAVLVVIAVVWGRAVVSGPDNVKLGAAPVASALLPRVGPWIAVLVAVAVLVLWAEPKTRALPWRGLLACSFAATAGWAAALALLDGPEGLFGTLVTRWDYLASLPAVGDDPIAFLRGFTDDIDNYTVHVRGHPPGTLLLIWTMDRLGLVGAGPVAALFVLAGASATPVALSVLRRLSDEDTARAAVPFVALAPTAVWIATSANAFYLGVASWGIALTVAATERTGAAQTWMSLAAGLVLGSGLHLTYGFVPLGAIVLAVVLRKGNLRSWIWVLGPAGAGVLAVALAFGSAGFWWPLGLAATREQYLAGVASVRPYFYSLVGNPAAFAIICGPAVAAGLGRLRDSRVWTLTGAALVAVGAANLSGMSKFEVERIWLHFTAWVLVACCSIGPRRRWWLGAQLATAIALNVLIRF